MSKLKFSIAVLLYFFLLRLSLIFLFDEDIANSLAVPALLLAFLLVWISKFIFVAFTKHRRAP